MQERTALLGLDHPRVVGVRDLVVDGNDLALVMDLVRGTDLRTRLDRERRLAPEAAVAIIADVADGLAAAHAAGIVHRDVKPENILLDMEGPLGPGGAHPALLTDFGVAKLIDTPRRTRATRIIGTPDYLAPEIVEGLPPRAAVDIYALATVLYELLAGFTPFGGGHPGAVLRRHVTETVVPLPGIPDELWQLLVQCLAKAPASRLRASELGARLRELLPLLAGMPPLDVDEPDAEPQSEQPYEEVAAGRPRRGAAPRRRAARARRGPRGLQPGHPHLDAGPGPGRARGRRPRHGARPAHAGQRRPGSARHKSDAVRKRRITLGVAAVVVAAAVGVGGWLATSDGDPETPPQGLARQSAPSGTRRAAHGPSAGGGRVLPPSRYAGPVAVVDVSEELKSLSSTMGSIEAVLDLDKMRAEIAVLEEQAAAPSLWDDPEAAQKITSKLSHLQAELRKTEALRGRIDDLAVLFELAEAEDDADTLRRGRVRAHRRAQGAGRDGGPHPPLRRVRRA